MDYPDVTSWRPGGERSRPEPPWEPHQADKPTTPAHPPEAPHVPELGAAALGSTGMPGALAGTYDPPSRTGAVDPGPRLPGGDSLERPSEDLLDIPPAKLRSLTSTRLLTIAILIALTFLGGVYVQKQHTYGYTPPAQVPQEFVPHGH